MKRMNEINFDMSDLRAADNDSKRPRRDYTTSSKKIKAPERARFKAQIYFKDGNRRYFFSLDYVKTPEGSKLDEWHGLTQLMKKIYEWRDYIQTATIYANILPMPLTKSQQYNLTVIRQTPKWKQTHSNVSFNIDGTAVLTPLKEILIDLRNDV